MRDRVRVRVRGAKRRYDTDASVTKDAPVGCAPTRTPPADGHCSNSHRKRLGRWGGRGRREQSPMPSTPPVPSKTHLCPLPPVGEIGCAARWLVCALAPFFPAPRVFVLRVPEPLRTALHRSRESLAPFLPFPTPRPPRASPSSSAALTPGPRGTHGGVQRPARPVSRDGVW